MPNPCALYLKRSHLVLSTLQLEADSTAKLCLFLDQDYTH